MNAHLQEYIERIRPLLEQIDEKTGHQIVSTLLAYKFGMYSNAVTRSEELLKTIEDKKDFPDFVKRAVEIVQDSAKDPFLAENVGKAAFTFEGKDRQIDAGTIRSSEVRGASFDEDHNPQLPIAPAEDLMVDPDALTLDNALLILYTVGLITSPDDEQALEEHQRFATQIFDYYQEKME